MQPAKEIERSRSRVMFMLVENIANSERPISTADVTGATFRAKRLGLETLLRSGGPRMVFQPVYRSFDGRIVKMEALSRFDCSFERSVEQWFHVAAECGMQVELELAAIRNAIDACHRVWAALPIKLSVNVSPRTVLDARFQETFDKSVLHLVSIEITEHEYVDDYYELKEALADLRAQGLEVAVDDVGAGFASMRHILEIRPDILKVDSTLVRSLDIDPVRQALISGIQKFARSYGAELVAEGVETSRELGALRDLDVHFLQGYFLSKPFDSEDILQLLKVISS